MTTKDIGLIASLHSLGYKDIDVDDSNLREIYFTFPEDSEIVKLTGMFYSDNLMVSASSYYQALKNLKSRIYYLKEKGANPSGIYR